ncbi:hypothetical protein TcasGA2_TC031282 [Tribolium castaneum]|uniref:Uncharacterized protein n=1 Tax=Tribolium castaneum TaxID=7070 RepID=A0A139WD65_TRICA|nr:hypothetical protein TcasGA2_TC031282 [Tribolium castaneum]
MVLMSCNHCNASDAPPFPLNTRKLCVKSGITQYPMFLDAPGASTRPNGRLFCRPLVSDTTPFPDDPSVPDASLSLDNSCMSGDPATSWSTAAAAAAAAATVPV